MSPQNEKDSDKQVLLKAPLPYYKKIAHMSQNFPVKEFVTEELIITGVRIQILFQKEVSK